MENEAKYRRRINVSQSVKNVITFDCTVESDTATLAEVVAESNALVAILKVLYPVEMEKVK